MKKVVNYLKGRKRSGGRGEDSGLNKNKFNLTYDAPLSVYGSSESMISSNDTISIYDPGSVNKGWNKLHIAAWVGDVQKMRTKLRKIAVDTTDDLGRTPLHLATSQGHANAVAFLIACKANMAVQDIQGRTALHKAMEFGHVDCAQLLLDRGDTDLVNLVDSSGDAPLHVAARNGSYDMSLMLLQKGANLELANTDGQFPLHVACASNTKDTHELIELLLRYGALINVKDKNEVTPLMIASGQGIINIVRLFLEYGANKMVKDKNGKTAYSYAAENHFDDIQEVLRGPGDSDDVDDRKLHSSNGLKISQESVNVITPPVFDINNSDENDEDDGINQQIENKNETSYISDEEVAGTTATTTECNRPDFLSPLSVQIRRNSSKSIRTGEGDGACSMEGNDATNNTEEKYETDKQMKMDNESSESDWADDFSLSINEGPRKLSLKKSPFYVGDSRTKSQGDSEKKSSVETLLSSLKIDEPSKEEQEIATEHNNANSENKTFKGTLNFENSSDPVKTIEDSECKLEDMVNQFDFIDENEDTFSCDLTKKIARSKTVFEIVSDNENQPKCSDAPDNSAQSSPLTSVTENSDISSSSSEELKISESKNVSDQSEAENENSRNIKISISPSASHCDNTNNGSWSSDKGDSEIQSANPIEKIEKLFSISKTQDHQNSSNAIDDGGNSSNVKEFSRVLDIRDLNVSCKNNAKDTGSFASPVNMPWLSDGNHQSDIDNDDDNDYDVTSKSKSSSVDEYTKENKLLCEVEETSAAMGVDEIWVSNDFVLDKSYSSLNGNDDDNENKAAFLNSIAIDSQPDFETKSAETNVEHCVSLIKSTNDTSSSHFSDSSVSSKPKESQEEKFKKNGNIVNGGSTPCRIPDKVTDKIPTFFTDYRNGSPSDSHSSFSRHSEEPFYDFERKKNRNGDRSCLSDPGQLIGSLSRFFGGGYKNRSSSKNESSKNSEKTWSQPSSAILQEPEYDFIRVPSNDVINHHHNYSPHLETDDDFMEIRKLLSLREIKGAKGSWTSEDNEDEDNEDQMNKDDLEEIDNKTRFSSEIMQKFDRDDDEMEMEDEQTSIGDAILDEDTSYLQDDARVEDTCKEQDDSSCNFIDYESNDQLNNSNEKKKTPVFQEDNKSSSLSSKCDSRNLLEHILATQSSFKKDSTFDAPFSKVISNYQNHQFISPIDIIKDEDDKINNFMDEKKSPRSLLEMLKVNDSADIKNKKILSTDNNFEFQSPEKRISGKVKLQQLKNTKAIVNEEPSPDNSVKSINDKISIDQNHSKSRRSIFIKKSSRTKRRRNPFDSTMLREKCNKRIYKKSIFSTSSNMEPSLNFTNDVNPVISWTKDTRPEVFCEQRTRNIIKTKNEESKETKSVASDESSSERYLEASNTNLHHTRKEPEESNIASNGSSLISLKNTHSLIDLQPMEMNGVDDVESKSDIWSMEVRSSDRSIPERFDERLRLLADLGNSINNELTNKVNTLRMGNGLTVQSENSNDRLNVKDNTVTSDQITMTSGRSEPVAEIHENLTKNQLDVFQSDVVMLLRGDYNMVEETLKKHNVVLENLTSKLKDEGAVSRYLKEKELKSSEVELNEFEKDCRFKALQAEVTILREKLARRRQEENTRTLEAVVRLQQEKLDLQATIDGLNQTLVEHRIDLTELRKENNRWRSEWNVMKNDLEAHMAEVNYLTRRSLPNDPAVVRKITKLEEQNKHLVSNYHNLAKDMELQKVQHRKHLETMFRQLLVSGTATDAGNLNTEHSTMLRTSIESNDNIRRSKSDPLFDTRTTQDVTLKIPVELRATTSVQVSSIAEDESDNKEDKSTMSKFSKNDRSTSTADINNSFGNPLELPAGKKDDGHLICKMEQNKKGTQECTMATRKNFVQSNQPVRFGVSCKNLEVLCNARQFSAKRFSTRPVRGNFKKINRSWAKAETYSFLKSKQRRRFGSKTVATVCVDSKRNCKKLNLEKYFQEQIPSHKKNDENSKQVSVINIVDAVNTEIANNGKVSCETAAVTSSQSEILEKIDYTEELPSTLELKFDKDKEAISNSEQTVLSAEVNSKECLENVKVSSEQSDKNSKNDVTTAIEEIVQEFSVLLGSDDLSLGSDMSEDNENFHNLKINEASASKETMTKVSSASVMGKLEELIRFLPTDDKDSNSTIKTVSDVNVKLEDNNKEEKRNEDKNQQDEIKSLKEKGSLETLSVIKNCSQPLKKTMVDIATGNDVPFDFLDAAVATDSKTLPITVSVSVGNVCQELTGNASMKDATSTLGKKETSHPECSIFQNKIPSSTSKVIQKMIETFDKSVGTSEVTESSIKLNENDRMINIDKIPVTSLIPKTAEKKPLNPPTETTNKILKKTVKPLILNISKNTQPLYKSTEPSKKSATTKTQRISKKSTRITRKGQTLPQFLDIPKILQRNLEDHRLGPKLMRVPKYPDKKKSRTVRFNPRIKSSSTESLNDHKEMHGSKKEEFIQGARLFTSSARTHKSIATEVTDGEQQEVSKDMSSAYTISLDKCNIYGTKYALTTMRNGEPGAPVILIGGGPADRTGPGVTTPTVPCPLHQDAKVAGAQNEYNLTTKTPYGYQEYFQYENSNSFEKVFPDVAISNGSEFNSRVQQIDRLVDLLSLQHDSSSQDLSKFSENVRRIRDILENRNYRSKYSRIDHQDQSIKSDIKPFTESIERVTAIFDDLETLQRADVQFHDDSEQCNDPDPIINHDEMIEPIEAEINTFEKDEPFHTKNKVVTSVRDQSSIRQCRRNLRRSIIMDFPYEKIQTNRDEHLKRLEIAMAKARTSNSLSTKQCSPTEQSRLNKDKMPLFVNRKKSVEFKRSRSLDAQNPAGNGSRVFNTVLDAARSSKDCAMSSRLSGSCLQGSKNKEFPPRKTLSLKQNPIDCPSECLTRTLLKRQLYNASGRKRVSTSVPRLS